MVVVMVVVGAVDGINCDLAKTLAKVFYGAAHRCLHGQSPDHTAFATAMCASFKEIHFGSRRLKLGGE